MGNRIYFKIQLAKKLLKKVMLLYFACQDMLQTLISESVDTLYQVLVTIFSSTALCLVAQWKQYVSKVKIKLFQCF